MTHTPETQLSLYVGGELDHSEALPVARHLEDCAECRKKADELRVAAKWLKSVAAEPDAGHIYTLRETALATLEPKLRWGLFGWLAAAVAALAFIFFAVPRPKPTLKDSAATVVLPPLLVGRASLGPLVLPSPERRRPIKRALPRLTLVAKNSEDMPVVRVKTSDPDVVILWVVGGGSEQEKEQ